MAVMIPGGGCIRGLSITSAASLARGGEESTILNETCTFFQQDSRPIMLFYGVCDLCNGGVKFVRDHDRQRAYIKSEAVLKIMEYIDLPFPQLAFLLQFVPLFVWDFAYENLADNHYEIFGRSESCEL